MLILVTTGDAFSYFRATTGAFVVSDEVVMNVSADTLLIDSMIVSLSGGFVDRLTGVAIETWTKLTVCTKLCMVVALAAVFDLELVESASYAMALCNGAITDVLGGTVIVAEMLGSVEAKIWPAETLSLEFKSMLPICEETLLLA